MGQTPLYALVNVFLPNLIKLRGPATIVRMIEQRDASFFAPLWTQAGVAHAPVFSSRTRESGLSKGTYHIGVMSLPAPKDMGDAYLCAVVVNPRDPAWNRIFLLVKELVLAKGVERTMLIEREGTRIAKHGEGPPIGADDAANGAAMMDAVTSVIEPQTFKK